MEPVERAFRLLPSERVLWDGRPQRGVPRDARWRWIPALMLTIATIAGLFSALLVRVELPGATQVAMIGLYLTLTAAAVWFAPSFLLDPCRFVVTDRRVLWKRGKIRRSIDRHAITYARIRWHRSVPTVGHLELVRAVPFGPLARKQRLLLHDLKAPDEVLAIIRGADPCAHGGDHTTPLTDRLDPGEEVVWGAAPEGPGIDWRDVATTLGGVLVLVVGLPTGLRSAVVLAELEELGLPVVSGTWFLLFAAMALTATLILAVGIGLVWHGVWRARAMGHDTEYVLTDRRLMIRRGRTELSLDRGRIVDVAETPGWRGLTNLYLVLDGPEARALADSGALSVVAPSRDGVPPVLYELRDPGDLRSLLSRRDSRPSLPSAA
ncbi:MAG TPA: hypothetical protein RMH99_20475 [Sandaracinaceae bacterium LLY-WYZ-13_1]|nr:hypothetical protein [Sandaracinaceae bacterium LLY-WYZ-13_1]